MTTVGYLKELLASLPDETIVLFPEHYTLQKGVVLETNFEFHPQATWDGSGTSFSSIDRNDDDEQVNAGPVLTIGRPEH